MSDFDFWQIVFDVKGLFAPKEGLCYEDRIVLKRKTIKQALLQLPEDASEEWKEGFMDDDDTLVFFKMKKNENLYDDFKKELEQILHFYAFVSDHYAKSHFMWTGAPLTPKYTLGNPYGPVSVRPMSKLHDKSFADREYALLEDTIKIYNQFSTLKKYLKQALKYYYRAIEDIKEHRIEEALIDLVISLEFLLSRGGSYRLALRTAQLISDRDYQFSDIFSAVRKRYAERGYIVHGSEKNVVLDYFKILEFRDYVRKVIFYMLSFDKERKQIINILDKSILHEVEALEELYKLKTMPRELSKEFSNHSWMNIFAYL